MENLKLVIGDRIRLLREETARAQEADFSQYDLANTLTESGHEITQGTIGHLESGRRLPSVQLLVAMADFFDTSLDYMTGRTKNASSIAAIDDDLQTGGISGRLAAIYQGLPIERRDEVYHFAQALHILSSQQQKHTPQIGPLPLSRRRRVSNAVRALLASIETELGKDIRIAVEQVLRSNGISVDPDT